MTLTRRRFLTISAAIAANPVWAAQETWHGHAFGAEVSLTIRGARDQAQNAIRSSRQILRDIEGIFSLYDQNSALVRLNSSGETREPDPRFLLAMQAANVGYHQTEGRFDPTIQPLWQAQAQGGSSTAAAALIGWDRVHYNAQRIRLDIGQALTFNGIAQGLATDLITDHLNGLGMTQTLVNIGEFRALGGPFTLGLSDPTQGHLGTRTLENSAIATSSPGHQNHILHPKFDTQWSTVSVEATTATRADCLSTGLCLAPRELIQDIANAPDIHRITLVDIDGNLTTI
jgi:thiamine biosynthesis lipoprotein